MEQPPMGTGEESTEEAGPLITGQVSPPDATADSDAGPLAGAAVNNLLQLPQLGLSQCRGAGARITHTLRVEEQKLHTLVTHGCSLVSNIEVAAVSANVSAQVESELSEEHWRMTIEEKTREAEAKLQLIQEKWRTAVDRAVAEDMFADLVQLKGESEALLSSQREVVESLRQEVTALDGTFAAEVQQQRQQRRELLRRLAEHSAELHGATCGTVQQMQLVADEERKQLVQRYSEQLDAAVTEFNEDLRALMTEALRGEAERLGGEVEAKLHPLNDSAQQLDQLETRWEQNRLEAARLRMHQCLERPRLQYRLRQQRQQYQATTEQVSEARRRLNELRPLLHQHRQQTSEAERSRAAVRDASLQQLRLQQVALQEVQQRHASRTAHLSSVQQQIGKMHATNIAALVNKLLLVERRVRARVLGGGDAVPPSPPRVSCREVQEALHPHQRVPALAVAAAILQPEADDSASATSSSESPLEEAFLLGMVQAGSFLLPQDQLPDAAGVAAETALLQLEHIFKEVGINSDADMVTLLRLARRRKPLGRASRASPLPITERARKAGGAEDDVSSDGSSEDEAAHFSNVEVLEILTEYTRIRGKDSARVVASASAPSVNSFEEAHFSLDQHPHYPPYEDEVGRRVVQNGDQRWEAFLDQLTKDRTRTWGIARGLVDEYRTTLMGRQEDQQRVSRLQQRVAEMQKLLGGSVPL